MSNEVGNVGNDVFKIVGGMVTLAGAAAIGGCLILVAAKIVVTLYHILF